MSLLLEDVSKWAKKQVFNTLQISISTIILTIILFFFLPNFLTQSTRYSTNNMNTTNKSNITQQIKKDINQYMHDTKMRLIFRTHADLADKLGVPQSDIILKNVINKTWNDDSLECLNPLYGKPLVKIPQIYKIKGWLIVWKLGNTIYEYHTSVKGDWVTCSKIEIPQDIAKYRSPLDR
jgi:competence protein ComGC